MIVKPLIPRADARRDVDDTIEYYLRQGAAGTARRFIDSLETAYRRIARNPATGSPRYAHELDLPGLRFRAVSRFPHIVFYVEHDDHIDVWRVLHGERDIAGHLRDRGNA